MYICTNLSTYQHGYMIEAISERTAYKEENIAEQNKRDDLYHAVWSTQFRHIC